MSAGEPTTAAEVIPVDIREEALVFAGVGLFSYSLDGAIIAIDRSAMRILEIDDRFPGPEAVAGQPLHGLFAVGLPDWVCCDAVAQQRRSPNPECPFTTLKGTRKWVLWNAFPVTDSLSGRSYIQAIIHDITADVLARQALQESEARFRCLFEQANVGIACLDLQGRIIESNTALQKLLWYPAEGLVHRTFRELSDPDDRSVDQEQLQALLAGELDEYTVMKRIARKDRQAIWCKLVCSLIRDAEGRPSFVIAMLEDTTDREEVEQAKSRFLSVLTHELRTPLANILGWAREALEEPELAAEALQIIRRNAESQSRMLNNLLEVSRFYHGRFTLRRESADLWEVIERASTTMRSIIEARCIELVRVPPRRRLPVVADVKRLHEVVCNLLDNAVKFTPYGGTVTLAAYSRERSVRLDVRDTGQGIAPEQLPVLFRPFPDPGFRDVTGGLHLGLALVKGIVEMHGGNVTVHSPGVGLGSTFSVILPSEE
ncbi:MAG: sensor histidine kinase [Armatimonadota bacterium]